MVIVKVEREFEFSAERLWAVISDFGDISWVPGFKKVEVEGEGVGMIRHITVPEFPQLHERLDAIDYEKMILDYSLPTVEYIQVKNYHARAQVIGLESERCKVIWSCKAEADGADEAQASVNTEEFYKALLSWIDDFLKK
ncbi:MAG: SRPBCC family protein [Deltaproteobacteria bacterium]|jgi:hypothetical protein|nr:SRPBCC family protein [Deltaproteobacteria bacterium]